MHITKSAVYSFCLFAYSLTFVQFEISFRGADLFSPLIAEVLSLISPEKKLSRIRNYVADRCVRLFAGLEVYSDCM